MSKEKNTGIEKLIVTAAASKIGKEAEKKKEEALETDSKENELETRLRDAIKTVLNERTTENIKRDFRKRRIKKYSFRTMLAFLIASTAFSICVMSVSALRGPVIDFLMGINNQYSTTHLHNGLYIDGSEARPPAYVPKGFIANSYSQSTDVLSIQYTNDNNEAIIFKQSDSEYEAMLDTEDAQSEPITLENGQQGLWIEKDGMNTLMWDMEPYTFMIQSTLSMDEMKMIAQSVHI